MGQVILGVGWLFSLIATAAITKRLNSRKAQVHFSIKKSAAGSILDNMDPIIRQLIKNRND